MAASPSSPRIRPCLAAYHGGAVGWAYALTLGFALVYLGEHYVIDLLAGATLAEGVRRAAPAFAPAARALSRTVQRLEAVAHG